MSESMSPLLKVFCFASLLLLAACSPSVIPGTGISTSTPPAATNSMPGVTSTTASDTPTAAVTPIPVTVIPATSQPGGGSGSTTTTPAVTQTESAGAPDQQVTVTLADEGKTIHLKVGQRFLVMLGEDFNWTVNITDQSIASRVIGITVIRGAQGVYEAHAPGQTTLTANGEPACRQSKPACAMPNRAFQVTIVVEP